MKLMIIRMYVHLFFVVYTHTQKSTFGARMYAQFKVTKRALSSGVFLLLLLLLSLLAGQ